MRELLALTLPILAILAWPLLALGQIETREIEYKHGDVTLRGYVAYNGAIDSIRPGILVIHEWWGLNDFAREQARRLAEAGYIAFAADMYGDGRTVDAPAEAQALAMPFYQDRAMMRARAAAALEVLRRQDSVDPERFGAIGYCFGGTVALELARSGAAISAAVSFHGGLAAGEQADPARIEASVLVLTGAADPLVPAAEREAFIQEMEAAGADYQMIIYGKARHSFTNPEADKRNMPPVAYNPDADRRSWEHMRVFLSEVFAREPRQRGGARP
jgi:dienelactone hydrolase